MQFESCSDDPRSGNTLTSPEFTLQSDEQLTFTMVSPPSDNNSGLAVHVYRSEDARRPAVLLGTYSSSANTTDSPRSDSSTPAVPGTNTTTTTTTITPVDITNGTEETNGTWTDEMDTAEPSSNSSSSSSSYSEIAHTVCLPAGTYQLSFIAAEAKGVTQSQAALTDVLLTGVSCKYNRSSGKQRPVYFTAPPSPVNAILATTLMVQVERSVCCVSVCLSVCLSLSLSLCPNDNFRTK